MLETVKRRLSSMPVIGPSMLGLWRLVKDPYLGPIGDRLSEELRGGARTVVQIGANDGIRFDPVSALIKSRRRWKALLVEPIPAVFDRLVANFGRSSRFMYECSAIGEEAGSFKFYYLSDEARKASTNWQEYFDLVGSLDRDHVVKALADQAEALDRYIVETEVPVITLRQLLDKWDIRNIDALVVDAEGYDWKIVRQALGMGLRPRVIFFEHSNLDAAQRAEALEALSASYEVEDVGIDFLCIRKQAGA